VAAPRLEREWAAFLSSLEKQRQYLHVRLNQARPHFEDGRLILSFPISDENGFYSRIIDGKELAFIKEELSRRLGGQVSVETRDAPEAANDALPDRRWRRLLHRRGDDLPPRAGRASGGQPGGGKSKGHVSRQDNR
jgi:hypothetical protein